MWRHSVKNVNVKLTIIYPLGTKTNTHVELIFLVDAAVHYRIRKNFDLLLVFKVKSGNHQSHNESSSEDREHL